MVVVEGQSTDFTVVWVGVLLWDVLEGTVRDVCVGGYRLLVLTALCLAHYFLCHLPQAHGAISGPWEFQHTRSIEITECLYYLHTKVKNKQSGLSSWHVESTDLASEKGMSCSLPDAHRAAFIHTVQLIQTTHQKLPCCH